MRFILPAAFLALFAVHAQAQSTDQAPATTPAPSTEAPATAPSTKPAHRVHHRQTLQQRFDVANTTHDGRLTKDQATAAKWTYVVRNFDAIDQDHKGYVTVDEIRAFGRANRGQRASTKSHNAPATQAAPAEQAQPSTTQPAAPQ
jgi:hypothetical protein